LIIAFGHRGFARVALGRTFDDPSKRSKRVDVDARMRETALAARCMRYSISATRSKWAKSPQAEHPVRTAPTDICEPVYGSLS
jgi:hypothetical protein